MELHKNIKEEIIVAIVNSMTLLIDEKDILTSDVKMILTINISLLCRFIKNDMELVIKTVEYLCDPTEKCPQFYIEAIEEIITHREKVDKSVLSKSNFLESLYVKKVQESEIQHEY